MDHVSTKTRARTSLSLLCTKSCRRCSFHACHLQFPSSHLHGRDFHWFFPGSLQCPPNWFPRPYSVLIVYPAARIVLIHCKLFLTSLLRFWLPTFRIWSLLTSPALSPSKLYSPSIHNTKQFLEGATPPGFCTWCFFYPALPLSLTLPANYFSLFMTQLSDYLQEAFLILPD